MRVELDLAWEIFEDDIPGLFADLLESLELLLTDLKAEITRKALISFPKQVSMAVN